METPLISSTSSIKPFGHFDTSVWTLAAVHKGNTARNWCWENPRPGASSISGLHRGGRGFPLRTIFDGLRLTHIHITNLHCASRTLSELVPPCCVLLDFKELKRHTTPLNGALALHFGVFSLAITKTVSSSASWTLPYFSQFFLLPHCFTEYKEALPIKLTRFSLLCSVLTLFYFLILGLCFFSCVWLTCVLRPVKMSCVHYKFSSKLDYNTVTFDGLHITLSELKRQIMARERLKATDCDLQITNAQTREGTLSGDTLQILT